MMRGHWHDEQGAIPFVVIGLGALVGTLGVAWTGQEWAQTLVGEAGGELTVWVLRGAFWTLDLVGAQAAAEPVSTDWYTPVLEGPAVPLLHLAALVAVAALIAETISGAMQGNAVRIGQAVLRAVVAGMLATAGASLLLAVGGALSQVGRAALAASGTSADAPLVPLQEVLMETAEGGSGSGGAELFVAFLAALVIVLCSLSIYFVLAMRPVLLAALIVVLPLAHALSVWTPLRRTQLRVWSLAFAVLLADAAILTMFAVANTAMGQPAGVDRLIFGTFGLILATLAPAALARVVGAPELQTAVSSTTRGTRLLGLGAGAMALRHGMQSARAAGATGGGSRPAGPTTGGALDGPGPGGGGPGGGGAAGSHRGGPTGVGSSATSTAVPAGGSSAGAANSADASGSAHPRGGSAAGHTGRSSLAVTGSAGPDLVRPSVPPAHVSSAASNGLTPSRGAPASTSVLERPAVAPVSGGWTSAVEGPGVGHV
ncbi:MAG: hypothetical protein WD118_10670 [Phycisphaeraceae bacterium]